jgi:hypothetical protein
MNDVIATILKRIEELSAQKSDVIEQLQRQMAVHVRPFDVALNELKGILVACGGPDLARTDLAAANYTLAGPVQRASRASPPSEMLSGDSITADQMKALRMAQNQSPALVEAVRANNPANILRGKLKGNGNQD